ncbi:MAG: MFS transporter [Negativicutes bacterium]|nr:MFS transporter [Negativicutes bacterium]
MSDLPALSRVQTVSAAEKPTRVRVMIIAILFITMLVAFLDRVNVAIIIADPAFKAEMNIMNDPTAQGLLMSFFLFAYALGNMFFGPIGDWLGPRKAVLISIFSWGIAVIMGGVAKTLNILYLSRVVLGVGEALHWPMMSKYIKNWMPPHERGKANAGWVLGLMIGPAISMPLYTWLVGGWGWRMSFWFCALIGFAILPLIWWTTDHPHQHKSVNKAELEYIQTGTDQEQGQQKAAATNFWPSAKVLLTNPDYILNMLTYWGSTIMFWGFMTWLPAYLKSVRGFSWAAMGWLSSLPFVLGAIGAILYGVISDKTGARRAPYFALGMIGCSSFIYLGATVQDNMAAALCMAMSMFFMGLNIPASFTIVQKIAPAHLIGTAAGLHNGSSQFLGAFVPAIVGYVIATTGSYMGGLMFMVASGAIGTCFVIILAFRKI